MGPPQGGPASIPQYAQMNAQSQGQIMTPQGPKFGPNPNRSVMGTTMFPMNNGGGYSMSGGGHSRIGSAAGAFGSPGTPTSKRGQTERVQRNMMPKMAHGGTMHPFQPFIAGDPKKDGKANPEAIIPGPDGTHVIPLKDLPKMAYGTERPRTQGYSFRNQGTAADKFRQWGGMSPPKESLLNGFYLQNNPGYISPNQQLQNQQSQDFADPQGAFYANKAAVAQGSGNYDQADFWRAMLQQQMAQRISAQGGGGGNWEQAQQGANESPWDFAARRNSGGAPPPSQQSQNAPYFSPGETRFDQQGNKWRWNQQLGRGEMIDRGPTIADATPQSGTYVAGENVGDVTMYNPYGTASVTHSPTPTTFTNGQGSAGPGIQFSGQRGTQTASDFFQGAANRQGVDNKYAVTEPGYGGKPSTGAGWTAYNSAMETKKRLKG